MTGAPEDPNPPAVHGPDDELPAELGETVVRGVSLAGGGYVLAQVLNLGFYLALARLATPSDFGEMAAGSLVVGISLLVTESGMMSALIHRPSGVERAASTAVVASLVGGLAFALLALVASPLIGDFFGSATIGRVAAALSGIIFLRSLTTVPDALLQRRFSFVRRVVIEPAGVIAFGVAAIIATANGLGVWGLVIGQYAFVVTEVLLAWVLVRWRPAFSLASYRVWRELVSYGRHVLLATVVLQAGEQADTLWLGRFLGTAPLGQYRYAFRLASTPYLALVAGAAYVLFPAFARITGDRGRFEAAFMRSLGWMCFVAFPAGMLILALGQPLAVVLFGDVWRVAGSAAMAMCLYPAMSSLSSISSEALKADGRPDLLTRMHALTTGLAAILMGALLPLGVTGVAFALSVAATVSGIYALSLVRRTSAFSSRSMVAEAWPSAVAAVSMGVLVLLLDRLVVHASDHSTLVAALCLLGEGAVAATVFLTLIALLAPARMAAFRRGVARLVRRSAPPRVASPPSHR